MTTQPGHTRDLVNAFYQLVAEALNNPRTDLATPIRDYVNTTDDPQLNLVVLAITAITQYAQLIQQVTADTAQALAYAHQILLINDLEDAYEQENNQHE